jgi:Phosphoesterase family.
MENKSYMSIVGNSSAPFINNTMIAHGLLETNYSAVTSGSAHNYLAMAAGITDASNKSAQNVFGALGTGTSWREFEESMPSACYTKAGSPATVPGSSDQLYVKGHNPAITFSNVSATGLCKDTVPLDSSFNPNNLPQFSYVVPNECNDMHTMPSPASCPMWNGQTNTGSSQVQLGDNWLSRFVPLVASHAIVLLTWDEGGSDEHVVMVQYGLGVSSGTDGTAYTHYSLEGGLYSFFRLGSAPGGGATATSLPIG